MSDHQLWRSERLLYRGVEKEDNDFLATLNHDAEAFLNSSPFLPIPRGKNTADQFREFLADRCLLGAIVCIPSAEDPDNVSKATPIGIVHLCGGNEPHFMHHRRSEVGLSISRPYQSKGYGTEVIKWVTRWGFQRCNLHRVGIGAAGWNVGAINLYKRLGFQLEATRRDFLWHDGKYYDAVELAILEDEWRAMFNGDT